MNWVPNLVRSLFAKGDGSLSMSFGIDVLAARRHACGGDTYTVREPVDAVTGTPDMVVPALEYPLRGRRCKHRVINP
jgi:hypothetical protein